MTIEQREQTFKEQVHRMISFPADIIQSFFEYWSEPNKSGTKMRFELEKTWDLTRRMKRWQLMGDTRKEFTNSSNSITLKNKVDTSVKPQATRPNNIIEELDQLLIKYTEHPTMIDFSEFGKHYEFMKAEKLLRPFTGLEVQQLKDCYKNNNDKCRCACVQMTMDGYVKGSITFAKIFELRKQLV